MKKTFALLLALTMLFSFAACSVEKAPEKAPETTTATTPETTVPEETKPEKPEEPTTPVGTLHVCFGASLKLVYNENGNVLGMAGTNEVGTGIAEAVQSQVGRQCVFALRSILRHAIKNNLLGDAKVVTVRVETGDQIPADDFFGTILNDCQLLCDEECSNLRMFILQDERLGADGNLTPATAKELAVRYLGVEETALTAGEDDYSFLYEEKIYKVDPFSGNITAQ